VVYVTPLATSEAKVEAREKSFSTPSGTDGDKARFAQVAGQFPNFFQILDRIEMKGESGKLSLPAPLDGLPVLSAPRTSDDVSFGMDGITRRIMLDYQERPLGHPLIAQLARPQLTKEDLYRSAFQVADTWQVWIDYVQPTTFPMSKFEDVVNGHESADRFRDKIVLIGDDFDKSIFNYVRTPLQRGSLTTPDVMMHAQMIDTLIRESAPLSAPTWFNWLMTSVIALLTIHAVFHASPLKGFLFLGATALVVGLIGFFAFWPFGVMVALAHAWLTIFLTYYFFIPYRLLIESRRSWQYFEKHRLLQEIEELKTNFISMISHDLKTPIARIQGMVDLILRDGQGGLSADQREALRLIQGSSDELLKFTNSALDYAKIESRGIELKKQSVDVNELIKECLANHEFLAKDKDIELRSELEPLFPCAVDPALLRQVISNLIENAIKYSPEHSKVLISSEEKDGHIVLQIADQGPGIPDDELPHIFMKFFRSRSAKSSPVKGSGLGLYLAKYFVELHGGRIWAESELVQGSTFTVELPLRNA
ncbi:MAG: histidine kinase, partial [Bdellovibrio sp.]